MPCRTLLDLSLLCRLPRRTLLGPSRFVRSSQDKARVRNDGGRDRRFKRSGKPRFMRIKIKTAAQPERARRLLNEENAAREADANKPRNYPKRPTMGPALEDVQPRLPDLWGDSQFG